MQRGQMMKVVPRTRRAKILFATVVAGVLVLGGGLTEVFASGVDISNLTKSRLLQLDDQHNSIENCVRAIDGKPKHKSKSSKITSVEVETDLRNECEDARMQVVVIDSRGRMSSGDIAMNEGDRSFEVPVSGDARTSRPAYYVNVY